MKNAELYFQSLPNLTDEDKQSLAHFQKIVNDIEPKYMEMAISEFEKQLKAQKGDGQSYYLLGDLYRRLGSLDESRRYFLLAWYALLGVGNMV